MSEAGAGSDVSQLQTSARRDGDDLTISGHKMWITNSLQADYMCALVNTSAGPPHLNKSLVVIPMTTPGKKKKNQCNNITVIILVPKMYTNLGLFIYIFFIY